MRAGATCSRRRGIAAALTIVICVGFSATPALPWSSEYDENHVKAEMVERFCRFVDWPETALGRLAEPFVIGLVLNDPVGERIEVIASERHIQGRRVEVRRLVAPYEASSCHLVWVGGMDRSRVAEVLTHTRGRPILTVGSAPGLAEAGVLINIVPRGDRLGFDVNLSEVETSGLRFSSKLLRLARIVAEARVQGP